MEDVNLFQGQILDAATVAEVGYNSLMKGKRIAVPGISQVQVFAIRFLPRRMVTKASKLLMSRR